MGKRTLFSIIVGAIVLALGLILRKAANAEGLQILLSLLAFVLVGLVAAGVKRGFLAGLLLGVVFTLVNGFVNGQLNFQGSSVATASVIIGVILPSLLAGGIGALFGLVGRAFSNRRKAVSSPEAG